MKKFGAMIFLSCLFGTVPARADMWVNVQHDFDGQYGTTNGGEFLITVLQDPIGIYAKEAQFTTFCLETDEFVSQNQNYYVTIGTSAWQGGSGGPEPDPLSPQSAYLYSLWLDGGIRHSDTAADALQKAIWYLEQETLGENNWLVGIAQDAVSLGGSNDSWYNRWGYTIGDIRVMSLWANPDHTGNQQDMLVRVPAPAAVLLGLLGLGVAGWKLRRCA